VAVVISFVGFVWEIGINMVQQQEVIINATSMKKKRKLVGN